LKAALELADSEGARAVEYQRRARKAEAELAALAAPAVQAEPVVWALRFPDDPRIGLSTMFDTELEATKWAEKCGYTSIIVVPLYDQPAAQSAAPAVQAVQVEAGYAADTEHLNCPHCNGSGHIDDVPAAQSADAVDAKRWRELERRASRHGFHLSLSRAGWPIFAGSIDTALSQSAKDS
jgi:hypothetical protein